MPGGKPVTAVPGLTARSPFKTLEPVFVTVLPPTTAKPSAVPSPTAVAARARVAPMFTSTGSVTRSVTSGTIHRPLKRIAMSLTGTLCPGPIRPRCYANSAGRRPKAGRARRAMTWRFLRDGCVRHEFSEAHLWLIRLSQISSSREGPMQQPPPGRGRDSSNPTIRSKRGQRSDYRVVVAMAMTAMPTATRSPTVSMMVVVASRRIIPARRSVRVWRRGARAGAADIGMGARDSATALSGGDVQVSGPGQVCTSDSPHVFRMATHRRRVGAPARDAASLRVWPHVRRYAGAERMSVQK